MQEQSMSTNNYVAVITMLAERWPRTFFVYERRRRPLAIGIHEALIAALDGAAPLPELWAALRYYTNAVGYLCACKEGAARVDLEGNVVGTVTAREAAWAATVIRERAARKAGKAAQVATAAVTVQAVEVPSPKRLSLSDLKAAALKRKTDVAYAM